MSDQAQARGRSGSFKGNRKGQRSVKGGGGGVMLGRGIMGPDERKFESEVAIITGKIKELENKLKPVSSTATQVIHTEIAKENAALVELEKEREENATKIKAFETKIREIGVEYRERKTVASDHLAGVRYKTEGRHDDAVQRLEQQILIRRCSSSEERKFKQEIEAVRKSKERLSEYSAVKSEVDTLKNEQESLRTQRDALIRQTKEIRSKEISGKDRVANLKLELEEAKERKKVGIAEREQIKKDIDVLLKEKKELLNRFRSEQLAFKEQLRLHSEQERMRRDQYRAAREQKRKYRVIEQSFQREQQYADRIDMCRALISHLQKLNLGGSTTNHVLSATGASAELDEEPSPSTSTTNLEPSSPVPMRSESAQVPITAQPQGDKAQGGYILRREEREEVLVPTRVTLTRKRSKKEKRRLPVTKRLNLNHTMFSQFTTLDLAPPNTFSDIPLVLSNLQDKLAYYEGMGKAEREGLSILEVPMMPADSGLGSTAPSEIVDEFTSSQEEVLTLDPGLGTLKKSEFRNGGVPMKTTPIVALPPRRSSTADSTVSTHHAPKVEELTSMSENSLIKANHILPPPSLPHNLVTMVSASTAASGSGTSIAAEGSEE